MNRSLAKLAPRASEWLMQTLQHHYSTLKFIKHYDWKLQNTWWVLSNRSALFQRRIATPKFKKMVPVAVIINAVPLYITTLVSHWLEICLEFNAFVLTYDCRYSVYNIGPDRKSYVHFVDTFRQRWMERRKRETKKDDDDGARLARSLSNFPEAYLSNLLEAKCQTNHLGC